MSPEGPMTASVGVHSSWYSLGDQLADFAMAILPICGAAPLPSTTPSSANQSANAAPPRVATSLANLASRSKSSILPGFTVGSAKGLGAVDGAAGSNACPSIACGELQNAIPAEAIATAKITRLPDRFMFHPPLRVPQSSYNARAPRGHPSHGSGDPLKACK